MPITPTNATLFPRLSTLAQAFEKYRFTHLVFRYDNYVPTTMAGQVIMAIDYDSDASTSTWTGQAALAHQTNAYAPVWSGLSLVARRTSARQRGNFDEVRWLNPPAGTQLIDKQVGVLVVMTEGLGSSPPAQIGRLTVEYRVEFSEPVTSLVSAPPPGPTGQAYAVSSVALGSSWDGGQLPEYKCYYNVPAYGKGLVKGLFSALIPTNSALLKYAIFNGGGVLTNALAPQLPSWLLITSGEVATNTVAAPRSYNWSTGGDTTTLVDYYHQVENKSDADMEVIMNLRTTSMFSANNTESWSTGTNPYATVCRQPDMVQYDVVGGAYAAFTSAVDSGWLRAPAGATASDRSFGEAASIYVRLPPYSSIKLKSAAAGVNNHMRGCVSNASPLAITTANTSGDTDVMYPYPGSFTVCADGVETTSWHVVPVFSSGLTQIGSGNQWGVSWGPYDALLSAQRGWAHGMRPCVEWPGGVRPDAAFPGFTPEQASAMRAYVARALRSRGSAAHAAAAAARPTSASDEDDF